MRNCQRRLQMDLYFSPLACSMAMRVALYEAGAADAHSLEVDPPNMKVLDHGDAADRAGEMAEPKGLLRAAASAALDRQSNRGGVRAVQGRAGAEEGGGLVSNDGDIVPAHAAGTTLAIGQKAYP